VSTASYALLIDVTAGLAVALVLLPILLYLLIEWETRRERLFAYLTPDALNRYYTQFLGLTPDNPVEDFRKRFGRLYGRRRYVLPILLLALTTIFAAWGMAHTLRVWVGITSLPDTYAMPPIALSALAGAFAWVIVDLLNRFRRRDFTSTDVYNSAFRVLLSVPLGFAFAQVAAANVGVPLAFLLGAFPTATLFTIMRRIGSQRLGLGDQDARGALELEKLQSVGRVNAERFQDEGVSTIANLAWPDPIDLTIRTNFDFNYVIDCMNQALLWVYFQDRCRDLYPLSLRGAQEVCALFEYLAATATADDANHTLQAAATILHMDLGALRTTLRQVVDDPYTQLIKAVWQ